MNAYALGIQSQDLLGSVLHDDEPGPYDSVPIKLKALPAWLPFRIELRLSQDNKPKKLKIPYNIAGRKADYTNQSEWMTFEGALTMLRRGNYAGIGIVIDRRFKIVGYDADSCISNGNISATALEHIATLNTYTERSLSGDGIHCLAYGVLPPTGRKSDGFEMYCDRRFFVVTGHHVTGTPKRVEYRQVQIEAVHAAIFGSGPARKDASSAPKSVTQFTPNTQVGVGGDGSDAKVSGLRPDAHVLRLLEHDAVAWRYFANGSGKMNPSRADFALGCKLAFYAGGDLQQMYRLFKQSALAKRAKCFTKRGSVDYVQYTLQRCLSRQKVFWQPSSKGATLKRQVGRPLSTVTKSILEVRRECPAMRPCEISRNLGINPAVVRKVLSRHSVRSLDATGATKSQGMEASSRETQPLSAEFRREPGARNAVRKTTRKHTGSVMFRTLARETGRFKGTLKNQLGNAGLAEFDRKSPYRKHRERKPRKLKPCSLKPIQRCRVACHERKSLTRGELKKRGWHENLIDGLFPKAGRDYKEKEFALTGWSGHIVKTRIYRVSRIKAFELEPWFEVARAKIVRQSLEDWV